MASAHGPSAVDAICAGPDQRIVFDEVPCASHAHLIRNEAPDNKAGRLLGDKRHRRLIAVGVAVNQTYRPGKPTHRLSEHRFQQRLLFRRLALQFIGQ